MTEQTVKTSYLSARAVTFSPLKLCAAAASYCLRALLVPQQPAVSVEQSKLPSSTNIPCLFTGRLVIKIKPTIHEYKDTFNRASDSIYPLISSAPCIFGAIKKTKAGFMPVRTGDLWTTNGPLLNLKHI